jgi:4'-phosphopantetheinyl transferase
MPATADRPWAPGPLRPRLADGAVHVWRADLGAVADELLELLDSEERDRAERMLSERDRRVWTRSRGVLRALLGRYLQSDPSTISFATGRHGKPQLDRPGPSFNLSHSGQLALYAFTAAGAVGVDVEVARRPVNEVALARRTFGADEARRLEELDPDVREPEFRRLWVRHEAELKCRGSGFGGVPVSRATGEPWIAELELGPLAAAAVAVLGPARELRCWEWPAP